MKIAIDIGNTSITCGLFKKENLIQKFNTNSKEELKEYLKNVSTHKK